MKKVISKSATQIAAKSEIRRFDVFAEWNRLKARDRKKFPESKAQGYGLAVAKIVAARKFSGYEPGQLTEWKRKAKAEDLDEPWWEHLGSRKEFEQKIIERMGKTFYSKVFQPAIRRAWKEKKRYEDIRDELRQSWNEQRKRS